MKIVVEPVTSRHNKKKNQDQGQAVVLLGPLPVIYSKLAKKKAPTKEDKYQVMFKVSKRQREEIINALLPAALEIAKIGGEALTDKEVQSIFKQKMRELDEEEGFYKVSVDEKMAFFGEEGPEFVSVSISGPDNNPLESPFLDDGSEAMVTFVLQMTVFNDESGKYVRFPFRLKAVKVNKPVFWQPSEDGQQNTPKRDFTDFSQLGTDY